MVYINFTNLNEETQLELLAMSKKDVENQFGKDLQAYASNHNVDYNALLDEEAIKNLYSYSYVFNI